VFLEAKKYPVIIGLTGSEAKPRTVRQGLNCSFRSITNSIRHSDTVSRVGSTKYA
jgi:hypothetical protein